MKRGFVYCRVSTEEQGRPDHQAGGDLPVQVPSGQRLGGQVGTEFCGPVGNARSEACTGVVRGAGGQPRKVEDRGGRVASHQRRPHVRRRVVAAGKQQPGSRRKRALYYQSVALRWLRTGSREP
jgi:hypothetical protein